MSEEFRPWRCPFDGGKANFYRKQFFGKHRDIFMYYHFIKCCACGATIKSNTFPGNSPEEENNKAYDLLFKWNTRATTEYEIKDGDTLIGPDGRESIVRKYRG